MSALRVLVADDELLARKRLSRLLSAMPGVEPCGECQDGEEVLKRVRQGGVDVVLLDVQMPGLSGVDAMALLPADGPYVVFCTAHPDHAVEAFDQGAVDYLLKPIEPARLQKALDRARSRNTQRRFHAEQQAQKKVREEPGINRLAVPTRQGIVLIDPATISHATLEGELVTIHCEKGEFLTDSSLQELQEKLPKERFERVHRRALLNLGHVSRLEPLDTGGYIARTTRGHAVEVSRQSARELRRRLGLRKAADEE
ncbi:MAG: response regulator transcription factor [Myxococcales bacterium]|nr:response regulator transcription factor [Myxococcales bacterium]